MPPSPAPAERVLSSRDQLLEVAARHFATRGYAAVTIRDIAGELGIRQPSIYYHVPGGKQELYVEVTLRHFERHRQGALAAIGPATDPLEQRLRRFAKWTLSRPPLDISRYVNSDYPELAPEAVAKIEPAFQRCIFEPLEQIFTEGLSEVRPPLRDARALCRVFFSVFESLNAARRFWESHTTEDAAIDWSLELLLRGILEMK
jgi:AcrR family transcriptional regulator